MGDPRFCLEAPSMICWPLVSTLSFYLTLLMRRRSRISSKEVPQVVGGERERQVCTEAFFCVSYPPLENLHLPEPLVALHSGFHSPIGLFTGWSRSVKRCVLIEITLDNRERLNEEAPLDPYIKKKERGLDPTRPWSLDSR